MTLFRSWREIPPSSRSRLQPGGRNLRLGHSAVAGTRVWDEHAGVRLTLRPRSEEHTSELQSLMRITYAVFGLKKKHNDKALRSTLGMLDEALPGLTRKSNSVQSRK